VEVATAEELAGLDLDLDGVVIASPVSAHVADATAVAGAGLPALLEKPPAETAAAAAALRALDPAPWIAFNRRFDPDARRMAAAVPSSGPVHLDLRLHYRRPGWAAHTVRDDALLDLGPHLVDWATWLSDRAAVEVECHHLTTERARLHLRLEDGEAAIDAATDRPHDERIVVRDAAGRTLASHRAGGLVAAVSARVTRRSRPDRLVTTLRGELAALAAALRDGGHPHGLGTVGDGVRAMAVIDAARESAVWGGAVPLPQAVPS
jgi:predicted dehydrogenase